MNWYNPNMQYSGYGNGSFPPHCYPQPQNTTAAWTDDNRIDQTVRSSSVTPYYFRQPSPSPVQVQPVQACAGDWFRGSAQNQPVWPKPAVRKNSNTAAKASKRAPKQNQDLRNQLARNSLTAHLPENTPDYAVYPTSFTQQFPVGYYQQPTSLPSQSQPNRGPYDHRYALDIPQNYSSRLQSPNPYPRRCRSPEAPSPATTKSRRTRALSPRPADPAPHDANVETNSFGLAAGGNPASGMSSAYNPNVQANAFDRNSDQVQRGIQEPSEQIANSQAPENQENCRPAAETSVNSEMCAPKRTDFVRNNTTRRGPLRRSYTIDNRNNKKSKKRVSFKQNDS